MVDQGEFTSIDDSFTGDDDQTIEFGVPFLDNQAYKPILHGLNIPSGNQTWRAEKWTIEISDFPS